MSVAVSNKNSIRSFLGDSKSLYPSSSEFIGNINKAAVSKVDETAFPTRKDEDWRFTDLKPISRNTFIDRRMVTQGNIDRIEDYYLPEADHSRLVFVNGSYNEELSVIKDLPAGVVIGNLSDLADESEIIKTHLTKYTRYENDVFTALNENYFEDGAFIHIPADTVIEQPVHVLNVYTDASETFFATPRLLVVGEKYSKATIIEDHVSLADNLYMTVPVGEVKVFEGANIRHVRLIRDNKNSVHVSRPVAHLDKHAEYHSYTFTLGAKLSRNEPLVLQADEEVDFTIDGLVMIDGEQIADTHSIMDHAFSHATSHQLHKVVVDEEAHSIFNGKIFVRRDAQKIDSFQENRNLLLSDEGKVNTKPQLEIFADDVKCSHGATIGQLDQDEIFYLQSRGLTEQKARELLVYAFALEALENVEVESVQELLLKEVKAYTSKEDLIDA